MTSPRKDSLEKALGKLKYSDDYGDDSLWFGVMVGVPVSKGKLKKIEFNKDFGWEGLTVVTSKELAEMKLPSEKESDEPILVKEEVNYYGQPAVLIAGPDKSKLLLAANKISFEFDAEKAILSANIHNAIPEERIYSEKYITKGDIEKAFNESDFTEERDFATQAQEHLYFETQIVTADFGQENRVLSVEGAMQAPFNVLEGLKTTFRTQTKDVVVTPRTMGGAFGGREDLTTMLAIRASVLAIKSGHKVRMKLDRQQDLLISTKRHPSSSHLKIGVKDGLINALEINFILDGGAYETISPVVLMRSMLHVGAYDIPNVSIRGRSVMTNTPPNGAFRGFGAPQVLFPVESQVDQMIKKHQVDPIEFRSNNLLKRNAVLVSGQSIGEKTSPQETFVELVNYCKYNDLKAEIDKFNSSNSLTKRGLGLATVFHGTGYTGYQDIDGSVEIKLKIKSNGTVNIQTSVTEFGQGSFTVLPKILAEELAIPEILIRVENINTTETPNSGPTVASRTTALLGGLVKKAAKKLKDKLGYYGGFEDYQSRLTSLIGEDGELVINEAYSHEGLYFDYETMQGHAYEDYSTMALAVITETDLTTYNTKVLRIFAVIDAGKIISLSNAEGQVQGGLTQGLGYALTEEMKMSENGYLNNSVSKYLVPTTLEMPEVMIKFIENESTESKGLGEIPLTGVAPAIANAIEDALGIRVNSLPITAEKLLEKIKTPSDDGAI